MPQYRGDSWSHLTTLRANHIDGSTSTPCPHGCTPAGGLLDDRTTLHLLTDSLAAGGHPDGGLAELLHLLMDDPVAAALVARMLRRDSARPTLLEHYITRDLLDPA